MKKLETHFQDFEQVLEAPPRFELGNKGFADLRLTTWLWRRRPATGLLSAESSPFVLCRRGKRYGVNVHPASSSPVKSLLFTDEEEFRNVVRRWALAQRQTQWSEFRLGAVDETRTRDLNLGKVALYQLSYYRMLGALGRN